MEQHHINQLTEPMKAILSVLVEIRQSLREQRPSPPSVLAEGRHRSGAQRGDLVDVTEGASPRFREGVYRAHVVEVFNDHELSVQPVVPDARLRIYTLGSRDHVALVPGSVVDSDRARERA